MSAGPEIEVVVPAHNAAATLEPCFAGLRAAGFAPGDVIVIDDASTDRTPGIATVFGARLHRTDRPVGAAEARNLGVAQATAPLVLFVDADVALHPGMRARVLDFFAAHPGHAGVIGSYDDAPPAPGNLSRIRNLLHHHTHQGAGGDVASFWTGCGALRRADFLAAGGFETGHRLEDVALGLALARARRRVRLDPALLCTHLKRWTLRSMVRADLFFRALPWSRMLLDPANPGTPAALNAGATGKISVALTGVVILAVAGLALSPWAGLGAAAALAGLAMGNRDFLALVARRLGPLAAMQAVGVLFVHYLCAGAGFAWAVLERLSSRAAGAGPSPRDRDA